MTDLLLDTNAYSMASRDHAGAQEALRHAGTVYLSPVMLGELYCGFLRGARREANHRRLEAFIGTPSVRLLAVTEETADHYAALWHDLRAAGAPVPTNDLWIAASALEHDLALLTADRHFERVPGLKLELLEL